MEKELVATVTAVVALSALIARRVYTMQSRAHEAALTKARFDIFNESFKMGFESGEDYGRRAEHWNPKYGTLSN
jgi:hypothetical protein